jgi:hypothetical protein
MYKKDNALYPNGIYPQNACLLLQQPIASVIHSIKRSKRKKMTHYKCMKEGHLKILTSIHSKKKKNSQQTRNKKKRNLFNLVVDSCLIAYSHIILIRTGQRFLF